MKGLAGGLVNERSPKDIGETIRRYGFWDLLGRIGAFGDTVWTREVEGRGIWGELVGGRGEVRHFSLKLTSRIT